jgi:uncharacterized iron-regulated membrane protein
MDEENTNVRRVPRAEARGDRARGTGPAPRPGDARWRSVARLMFHSHLWLGIAGTGILLIIAVTGILLNHKREFGLMPDPAGAGSRIEDALPLATLVQLAEAAVAADVAAAGVDRMDVRPRDGLAKVRFRDRRVLEVTLDLGSGAVIEVGERNDVFLEKLHSGEIFGDNWVLLSDAGAVLLLILLISGYWLWLYPRRRV